MSRSQKKVNCLQREEKSICRNFAVFQNASRTTVFKIRSRRITAITEPWKAVKLTVPSNLVYISTLNCVNLFSILSAFDLAASWTLSLRKDLNDGSERARVTTKKWFGKCRWFSTWSWQSRSIFKLAKKLAVMRAWKSRTTANEWRNMMKFSGQRNFKKKLRKMNHFASVKEETFSVCRFPKPQNPSQKKPDRVIHHREKRQVNKHLHLGFLVWRVKNLLVIW